MPKSNKLITCFEYEKIPISSIPDKAICVLKKLDLGPSQGKAKKGIFDWSSSHYLKSQNYVGVIQAPGVTIEILPKLFRSSQHYSKEDARKILLNLLSYTRNVPFKERELASILSSEFPILEAYISVFIVRLRHQIMKGLLKSYINVSMNSKIFKGKLLVSQHLNLNGANKAFHFLNFDEFSIDNLMNQIIKKTILILLKISRSHKNKRELNELLCYFDEVSNKTITNDDFSKLHLNRINKRFSDILNFCKHILFGISPSAAMGTTESFCLLFSMHDMFEQFVSTVLKKYSAELGLDKSKIKIQRGDRFLVRKSENGKNKGFFKLIPDILIKSETSTNRIIIDTKWKLLVADKIDNKNGASQADFYQMYAYANQYNCAKNLLLYPKVPEVSRKRYLIDNDDCNKHIEIDFIELSPSRNDSIKAVLEILKYHLAQ